MRSILFSIAVLLFGAQTLSAQTPAELKSWLPAVDGWTVDEAVEVFNPDNLFDRINGAAPLFIENNFREMTSMEYKRGEDYITIQAYRHAAPEDAFGMYASERSTELPFFPIGGEAQGDEANVFFFAGDIYVKMWTNASEGIAPTLRTIAAGLAEKIDPKADYPAAVRAFPVANKVPHSETYITSNYIGHNFLNKVYTAEYRIGDKPFQIFVLATENRAEAEETLKKYLAFTRQDTTPAEGFLTIRDRYNGDIPLVWKGGHLVGIFAPDGDTLPEAEQLLNGLADSL